MCRVSAGSELELQCAATGDPAPLITWFKDGRQVDNKFDNKDNFGIILI